MRAARVSHEYANACIMHKVEIIVFLSPLQSPGVQCMLPS